MRLKVKYFHFSKKINCSYLQKDESKNSKLFSFFSGIAEHPMDMVEDEEDSEVEFVKK